MISLKRKTTLACIKTITHWFLSNLIWWYGPLSSIFWYKSNWPWSSLKVTDVWEIKNLGVCFLRNFTFNLDEIQYVATTCRFVKVQAKFIVHKYCSSERTLLTWFHYTINIVLCWDTCEPICFKLGMMLDMTKLCSLIPAWINWWSLKATGSQESHSKEKLHKGTQMFMMVDYVREMTLK